MSSNEKNYTNKRYQEISLNDLSKQSNLETYVQIRGTDISLAVSLLDETTTKRENTEQLIDLYYQYLVQGKKDGYSTPYLETQLKNIKSLLDLFSKHASDTSFRIRSST